jgi:YbbR domain-containing protein
MTLVRGLLDNLPLRIASLALAVLLWFVIAGEKTSEMGLSVPVELQNFPQSLELTGEPVNAVEVRLRATPGVIQRLGPGDISAQLDLAGMGEGERIVHLAENNIRVPFGVKVVKISPTIITLNLERTLQKVVPIRPRLLGRPATGHEVSEVLSEPPQVKISGPKSRVQEVESAFTEPVSVESAEADVVDDVNLGLEDPLLRIQGTPRVRVTARVRELREKRSFEGLSVSVRGGAAAIAPRRVRVVLEGPADSLKRVRPEDVRPYVDVSVPATGAMMPLAVELLPGQAGVTVHHSEPAEVVVRVTKKGS